MDENADPTVLVVDDDVPLLDLYDHFLRDRFVVRTASSGREALDRIDDSVDIVLLDRRMPGMTGDDVLERIRTRGFDCPVMMVTAVEPDTDIIDLGFDDYLVKPVTHHELEDLVEALLRRMEYDQGVRRHFALASKVAALETSYNRGELERDGDYLELVDRLDASQADAETALQAMTRSEVESLFRDLDSAPLPDARFEE